jgi:hypothetical protein
MRYEADLEQKVALISKPERGNQWEAIEYLLRPSYLLSFFTDGSHKMMFVDTGEKHPVPANATLTEKAIQPTMQQVDALFTFNDEMRVSVTCPDMERLSIRPRFRDDFTVTTPLSLFNVFVGRTEAQVRESQFQYYGLMKSVAESPNVQVTTAGDDDPDDEETDDWDDGNNYKLSSFSLN